MQHPYNSLPMSAFWSRSIARTEPKLVDPVGHAKFYIGKDSKISTAGSCFAQHIARILICNGYNYIIEERAPSFFTKDLADKYFYGAFSARYGNIYTSRQLRQLFDRAYNKFFPLDSFWRYEDGFIDPFRPQLTLGGYFSERELIADREQHLASVRRVFESSDVFIFTLGLTEAWERIDDGAVFPICPGVKGGAFDSSKYRFINLSFEQVREDLECFLSQLWSLNPSCRVVFTVSPVPLVTTASGNHVLTATTYSKSVLRAVAGELEQVYQRVSYFPSYEIISGNFNGGEYYMPNKREVTSEGVSHVMRLFFKHYANQESALKMDEPSESVLHDRARPMKDAERLARVLCDEELLDRT